MNTVFPVHLVLKNMIQKQVINFSRLTTSVESHGRPSESFSSVASGRKQKYFAVSLRGNSSSDFSSFMKEMTADKTLC